MSLSYPSFVGCESGGGGVSDTRQSVYDAQGIVPVDLTTSATLDLESPGITWSIRDDLESPLFLVVEGSATSASKVQIGAAVDSFDVDAVASDFSNGATFGTAGTGIQIAGVAGVIERASDLILRASGSGELFLDDSNQPGSWAQTNGIKLSETSTEWSDFETAFGEVSLLNAILQAFSAGGGSLQSAYNGGATITTSASTDLAFTLSSGDLVVEGSGAVSFGAVNEVSSFRVDSSGVVSIGSRSSSDLTMQASTASAETLDLVATNTGSGTAGIALSADDRISLTSALAETVPGFALEQTGAGGERVSLYVGSTSPDGAIAGLSGSLFLLDDAAEGQAWINTSASGSGSEWSRLVESRSHKALRDLIHFVDDGPADGFASGAYRETTSSGVFPTAITWYDDATKARKIVDLSISYSGAFPISEVWRMYDTDGSTVLVTLTDAITYSGAVEASRSRTWA